MSANFGPSELLNSVIANNGAYVFDMKYRQTASVQVNATVGGTTAKTANYAVAATLVVQDITYTANIGGNGLGSQGNATTVAYVTGGTAGSEVVTVTGSALSVQIQSGVSTATQISAALTAAGTTVSNLVSFAITGTGSHAQTAAAATNLAGGLDSHFIQSNSHIQITANGMPTGTAVQLTATSGSLPTGLSAGTTYYVYQNDANDITLYTTLAGALAGPAGGSPISFGPDGTAGGRATITPTSLTGASYQIQKSNDYNPHTGTGTWTNIAAGETLTVSTNNITTTGSTTATWDYCTAAYGRVLFSITSGTVTCQMYVVGKQW